MAQALTNAVERPEWLEDERFKTPALRDRHANERLELTQSALLTQPAEHWLAVLEAAGVPCAPVLTRREMIEHPQVQANGIIEALEHPHAGAIRQARYPARFEQHPLSHQRPAPLLDEHQGEILAELAQLEDSFG